jgi:elongation factor P
MISVNELRSGATFSENKDIFEVLTFEHIKMGRGSATIKVKVRNLRNGSITERGFINGEHVNDINLEKKEFQFLYKDSVSAYFMDPSTFEQHIISLKKLNGEEFLKEGDSATIRLYQDEPLALMLPPKVTLKVIDTPPGVKGDSASNMYKEATLENGAKTKVPLFINIDDMIVVDTRDGSYTKRA